jgi:hypothetical protein
MSMAVWTVVSPSGISLYFKILSTTTADGIGWKKLGARLMTLLTTLSEQSPAQCSHFYQPFTQYFAMNAVLCCLIMHSLTFPVLLRFPTHCDMMNAVHCCLLMHSLTLPMLLCFPTHCDMQQLWGLDALFHLHSTSFCTTQLSVL